MARLFITDKEQSLVADWTKEFMKDVNGQYVYYYPVSTIKTLVDDIYQEAVEKIFERPIKINVMCDQNKRENQIGTFGVFQKKNTIEVYFHLRDLQDKGITLFDGDFFAFGDEFYEIMDVWETNNVFGQEEYKYEMMVVGNQAGNSEIEIQNLKQKLLAGRTYAEHHPQVPFVQQRGLETNEEGETADYRRVRAVIGDQMPEIALGDGPRKVGPVDGGLRNSIYDE